MKIEFNILLLIKHVPKIQPEELALNDMTGGVMDPQAAAIHSHHHQSMMMSGGHHQRPPVGGVPIFPPGSSVRFFEIS